MTEKQLDLIREGKIPLRFGDDGLPILAHQPIYEMLRFISALAQGYMRLYNRQRIYERVRKGVK